MFTIFGASGKVGGAAAVALRQRGLAVRAVVRDPASAGPLVRRGCTCAVADLHDEDSLRRALQGSHGVLMICPLSPRAADVAADMEQMATAASAAIAATRPPLVVAISDYGAQHPTGAALASLFHRFEEHLRASSVPTLVVRSAEQMENWSRSVTAARRGSLPFTHDSSERSLAMVAAADVGRLAATRLVADAQDAVIHCEGPRRQSVQEVAAVASSLLGREVRPTPLSRESWDRMAAAAGFSADYARLVFGLREANAAGLIEVEASGEVVRGPTSLVEALTPGFA